MAAWAVSPGTYVPGPVRGSIRATFPADSLMRTIKVRLINAQGCDTVLTMRINLVPPVVVPPPPPPVVLHPFVPNLVTANNDGLNERFAPVDLGPGPYTLRVYNKWGHQVFADSNYQDGFPPDADVPEGNYYYQLTTPTQTYKGWVEVVR